MACMMVILAFASCKRPELDPTEPPTEQVTEPVTEKPTEYSEQITYNPLTGKLDLTEDAIGKRPIAVVISNAPKARPQWGLSTPDITIEGVTEGGISRMLGLYSDINKMPEKLGPVRSARHDFIEMAQGFDAVFVHAGESTYATRHFSEYNVDDIDGCQYDGTWFKRDAERRKRKGLEHSMYLTPENLRSVMEYQETRTELNSDYKNLLKFTTPEADILPTGGSCEEIYFSYSGDFKNTMKYDATTKLYTRYHNGDPMLDGNTDGSVTYKNILLLYLDVKVINSGVGVVDMDLSSGEGVYVSNGMYEQIKWEKGDATSSLKLYKTSGETLTLNIGNSYIGLVPTTRMEKTEITGADTGSSSSSSQSGN